MLKAKDVINKLLLYNSQNFIQDPAAIKTRIPTLNNALNGGFSKGNLYIISGREAIGKTMFLISLACDTLQDHNLNIGVLSLDISDEEWIKRMLSNFASIDIANLYKGTLNEHEQSLIHNIAYLHLFNNIEICSPGYINLKDVKRLFKKWVLEKNIKVIFIDDVQLISIKKSLKTRHRVFIIAETLKKISVDLNVTVIVTVCTPQNINKFLPRNEQKNIGPELPSLKHLKKIGPIDTFADVVAALHNFSYFDESIPFKPQSHLILLKNNFGSLGRILIKPIYQFQRFEEVE